MSDKIHFDGFHATTKDLAKQIEYERAFKPSVKENEWLGKGIYFWNTYNDAIFWANKSHKGITEMSIITVSIDDYQSNIVDLDIKENMDKLISFIKQYNEEMHQHSRSFPNFGVKDDKIRCFYCELFKRHYNINVLMYSFQINGINAAGFINRRRQICVSKNDIIAIIEFEDYRKGDDYVI